MARQRAITACTPIGTRPLTTDEMRFFAFRYDAEVAAVDEQIRVLFSELDQPRRALHQALDDAVATSALIDERRKPIGVDRKRVVVAGWSPGQDIGRCRREEIVVRREMGDDLLGVPLVDWWWAEPACRGGIDQGLIVAPQGVGVHRWAPIVCRRRQRLANAA